MDIETGVDKRKKEWMKERNIEEGGRREKGG